MLILEEYPSQPLADLTGCIVTIGVFDGVHVGHRFILDTTLAWARTEDRPAVVVTFTVHPDAIVHGKAPPLLQSVPQRLREMARIGMDACLALPFDERIREISAEQFVEEVFVRSLGIRGLVLGHDTAIGKDRRGDAPLLQELSHEHGFEMQTVGEIAIDGVVASSSRIRRALEEGDLDAATRLLGRHPSVLGRVVRGAGRGRGLGFPTANLEPGASLPPREGVYACLALVDRQRHEAICNIGRRPTFETDSSPRIEVHLLDFQGDLYGATLEVVFLSRLRDERKFAGVDELKAQILADRAAALEVFRRTRGSLSGR